jgi:uncharacterized protein (DUF1697 family)
MLATYVALLRGVNVGGKNMLPMKELGEIFTAAGCAAVRTFIQSGNVVFRAAPSLAARLPRSIPTRIEERFGHKPPVILRSAEQLSATVRANPFLQAGAEEQMLHVLFLADEPAPELVQKLDPARSPPDTFAVRGQDVYLCLPNGAARTKLTNAYFDSKLSTISTGRNWRTVLKLRDLMAG